MPAQPRGVRPEPHSQEYVTLREYIDLRFNTVEEATAMARQSMEKRLDGMNEFRDTLKDQAAKFVTVSEVTQTTQRLVDDIKVLQRYQATMEGKASQSSVYIGYGISLVAIILSVMKLLQ